MTTPNCGCCPTVQLFIAEHIDPSGTIEAGDNPETIMEQVAEMYATTPGGHPVTLYDVMSYLEGVRQGVVEDWVCPECYSNVRCDCA
jgi:hypothetical protein